MINNIEHYIEHTLLRSDANLNDIYKLIDEAIEYNFFAICINPYFVKLAKDYILKNKSDLKITTVIGFPLGANLIETKVFEAKKALIDGADEFDMVMNISAFKSNKFDVVFNDISSVKEAVGDKVLKVIIETDLLSKNEIIKACKIAIEAKANFVKTSTGFIKNGIGATLENVKIMYDIVKDSGLKVKASGGIKTYDFACDLINISKAARLGTSSGVNIFKRI